MPSGLQVPRQVQERGLNSALRTTSARIGTGEGSKQCLRTTSAMIGIEEGSKQCPQDYKCHDRYRGGE